MEKETRSIKHILTEEEKKNISCEMAKAILEEDEVEDSLKSIKSQFNAKLEGIRASIKSYAEKIRSGYEFHQVVCEVRKDYKLGLVSLINSETGEMVEERKMTKSERQLELGLSSVSENV